MYIVLLKNALIFLICFRNVLELFRKKSAQPEHVILLKCQQQFPFENVTLVLILVAL